MILETAFDFCLKCTAKNAEQLSLNDVVDNQIAVIRFEGGQRLVYYDRLQQRMLLRYKIYGTKGELVGMMEQNRFEVRLFGGETIEYKIDSTRGYGGHGGGDAAIMDEFYKILCGQTSNGASFLDVSLDSHKMAFGAEKARIKGKIIRIK